MTTLSFIPWAREGIAASLDAAAVQAGHNRPKLTAEVVVKGEAGGQTSSGTATAALQMLGPGDVLGIGREQVIRTFPLDGATGVETEIFPAIEFDSPSLPWLVTPEEENAGHSLTPWICLVVVRADEVGFDAANGRLMLSSAGTQLPKLNEAWAWAHVQYAANVASDAAAAAQELESRPSATLSRLLCPRQLEEQKQYIACVVPTYSAGVQAGLGGSPGGEEQHAPAWTDTTGTLTLPVYYSFSFTTGEGGDFLALAQLLAHPPTLGAVGTDGLGERELELDQAGFEGSGGLGPMTMDSIISPIVEPGSPHWSPPPEAVRQAFEANVQSTPGPPRLLAPVYGGMQAGLTRNGLGAAAASVPKWLTELNYDPTLRVVAAVGAQVVQSEQEQLVDGAWQQVEGTPAVNNLLARAQLAQTTSSRHVGRHFAQLATGDLLALAAPQASRILIGGSTLASRLAPAGIPPATISGAYRRLARPRGPFVKHATAQRTTGAVAIEGGKSSIREQLLAALGGNVTAERVLAERLSDAARAEAVERARARLSEIQAKVDITAPLVVPLMRIAPDVFLSGAGGIPQNTALTLKTNSRVIAAYLVGANSELNRELTWRGLPVDRRGTPMRVFWDRRGQASAAVSAEDVDPIDKWSPTAALEEQIKGEGSNQLVLAVRAELLRRYPRTAVYAVEATPAADGTHLLPEVIDEAKVAEPMFVASMPPDIRVFVFAKPTPEEAIGAGGKPGWFFVFQEQASETRFAVQPVGTTRTYWTLATLASEGNTPVASAGNSAEVAAKVRMPPLRCALYASALLPPQSGPQSGAPVAGTPV
jgi:hypothetical protein